MKTVGFPISRKENENRRTIIPRHIKHLSHPENLYFESGYGEVLGIADEIYEECGCHICDLSTCLKQDVICDPKIGDANYLDQLSYGQTIFGWIHATQNKHITDKIVEKGLKASAWEHMYESGRHIFWRNNELAGEAAVMHAFQCFGKMPYETNVAVIGRGNTARGAIKILNMLGANVSQFDRKTENLLRKELGRFEVVVNCVLWDVARKDHIISRIDLKSMRPGSMIIDVSCDRNGGIETSIPTSIEAPVYTLEGVIHYVVDHTPALFYKTFTNNNSEIIYPYIEQFVNDRIDIVLKESMIVEKGIIMDEEIIKFQNR